MLLEIEPGKFASIVALYDSQGEQTDNPAIACYALAAIETKRGTEYRQIALIFEPEYHALH